MTQPNESKVKQPAAKADNVKADSKQARKERKGNTFLLIIIILILTLIVSIGAIFLFDFAGLKAEASMWIRDIPVVGKLLQPVVENKNPEQIAKEEIEQEKRNLEKERLKLSNQAKELEVKAKELENKEKELALKEVQINDTLERLSEKFTSVKEQVTYLEKVDNTKAMNIIMSMDSKASAVQILRNMKKEKASAILAQMDPLQAAQLLEDLAVAEVQGSQ
jgi:flagellar motility protein MotE (MotC chaperone)